MLLTIPRGHPRTAYLRVMLTTSGMMHRDRWRIRNGETGRRPHPAMMGRADRPPIAFTRAEVRATDAVMVEELTSHRRSWAPGVQLPTVEDLAPTDTVKVSTALRDRDRVTATPHRPEDLNQLPPTALPRGGDPVPVAHRRGRVGHHYARTSTGGAPT